MRTTGYLCKISILLLTAALWSCTSATERPTDETYVNPVIHADYSDPDVVRSGDDFYMVASSFNCVPGLPVLHSSDLVTWSLIGHALKRLRPERYYDKVHPGGGVWAPCIRIHNGEYYIYYPDPDHGIFLVKASDPSGPWSDPICVRSGRGLIDPSPLWDDDGGAYLAYAYAGSRAGVKSVLMVSRMTYDGTSLIGDPVMVFDGHNGNPTVEGPKFYRRNGWYYIFAPAGGVTGGWQLVLRSKNVFGPYEVKTVMHQGGSDINGPHQGAWVTTRSGEDWFLHFQDKGPYGRVVHLQPMKWMDDWPVIGLDEDGDGTGEPVTSFIKPDIGRIMPPATLQRDDEFNASKTGLQWQWNANPSLTWGYPSEAYGCYRLNCTLRPDSISNLWEVPNLFLQKLPAEKFTATAHIICNLRNEEETAGMVVMGRDYRYISLTRSDDTLQVRVVTCMRADEGAPEEIIFSGVVTTGDIFFRVTVGAGAEVSFSYSTDGEAFIEAGDRFRAREGIWIGAKIGFFAIRTGYTNDSGYADIDWFRINTAE
jgi:beta-xylosidase